MSAATVLKWKVVCFVHTSSSLHSFSFPPFPSLSSGFGAVAICCVVGGIFTHERQLCSQRCQHRKHMVSHGLIKTHDENTHPWINVGSHFWLCATSLRTNIHSNQCKSFFFSFFFLIALPDNDIHDQHVSNQPHDAHYGVKSGDGNRYDNRIGVDFHVVPSTPLGEACVVGEVPTQAAAIIKRAQLAPLIRFWAVAGAVHGPRPVRTAGAFFTSPQVPVERTRCLWCPAGCFSVVCSGQLCL